MDKGTSDERLLKLIEGSGEHKQNANVNIKRSLVSSFPDKLKSGLIVIQKLKINLLVFNKVLMGLAGLLSLLFVFKLFSGVGSSMVMAYPAFKDMTSVAKMVGIGENQSTMRKTILSQDIKRNIFLPFGVKVNVLPEDAGINLSEEIKDLKLVGIIWSENPEVMIETGKDSRTYTLEKGESFNNGKLKIKEITNNSVTLEIFANGKVSEYVLR